MKKTNEFKREWTKLSKRLRLEIPYCEKCGRTDRLLVHHLLIRKLYPEYALERNNLVVLCPRCHNFCRGSAHKDGMAFAVWLMDKKPEQFEWIRSVTEKGLILGKS